MKMYIVSNGILIFCGKVGYFLSASRSEVNKWLKKNNMKQVGLITDHLVRYKRGEDTYWLHTVYTSHWQDLRIIYKLLSGKRNVRWTDSSPPDIWP